MVAYSAILPPKSLGEALRPVHQLNDADFNLLIEAVSGPRSFALTKDEIEALRNKIPHGENITFLIGTLGYIYGHLARLLDAGMSIDQAIEATVNELQADGQWKDEKAKVSKRFFQLFESAAHRTYRKIQRLQSGFIANAVSFASFVDVRPDFGDGDTVQLQAYLPMIQFRITTDSGSPTESKMVFQITETGLTDLKKEIARVEAKLSELRTRSPIATQLMKL